MRKRAYLDCKSMVDRPSKEGMQVVTQPTAHKLDFLGISNVPRQIRIIHTFRLQDSLFICIMGPLLTLRHIY